MTRGKLKIIGWREWVGLPDLGIDPIKVKVDSGARTCALHATKIKYTETADGQSMVSFVVPITKKVSVKAKAQLLAQRIVKSSHGHATLRPVIVTRLRIGQEEWPVEVTLVNRDPMGFRMLLGRQCLKKRFLIHPSRSFIQSNDVKSGSS
jgi:hypothetical protein